MNTTEPTEPAPRQLHGESDGPGCPVSAMRPVDPDRHEKSREARDAAWKKHEPNWRFRAPPLTFIVAWDAALDHAAQEQRNPVLGPECPKCGTIPLNLPPETEAKIRALFPELDAQEQPPHQPLLSSLLEPIVERVVQKGIDGGFIAAPGAAQDQPALTLHPDAQARDLTLAKTKHVQSQGGKISGFVLTTESGHCIIDMSAVRWLTPNEWWGIMHEVEQPVPPAANKTVCETVKVSTYTYRTACGNEWASPTFPKNGEQCGRCARPISIVLPADQNEERPQ